MTWTIWAGLGVGFAAGVGAMLFLVVRLLEAWRELKRLRRHVARELDRLDALSRKLSEGAARAGDQEKLAASLGRLQASLARLAVLRGALDEATDTFGRVAAVYPRK